MATEKLFLVCECVGSLRPDRTRDARVRRLVLSQSGRGCISWYGMQEGDREVALEEARELIRRGIPAEEDSCSCFWCAERQE